MKQEALVQSSPQSADIELPLVKIGSSDVLGALFVSSSNEEETLADSLLKLQTWIVNFAEEQVKVLRDSELIPEEEIEEIKRKICVISPITLTLYLQWLQMESFCRMPDSEKERYMLEKMPDRFRARFRRNLACRNARETSSDNEAVAEAEESDVERMHHRQNMSFIEFLREFSNKK